MDLRDRILEHQKRRLRYMAPLADTVPDHPQRRHLTGNDPEHMELALPSAYKPDTLAAADLESLADLEQELRRGICNDALDSVKQLLGARAYAIKQKNRHVRGQVATTRSEATIHAHTAKISKAQWRYTSSREALLRLGASESDSELYLELTSSDLKPLQAFLEQDSRGVGQGYTSISWIWRSDIAPNVSEWQVNGRHIYTFLIWLRTAEYFLIPSAQDRVVQIPRTLQALGGAARDIKTRDGNDD